MSVKAHRVESISTRAWDKAYRADRTAAGC